MLAFGFTEKNQPKWLIQLYENLGSLLNNNLTQEYPEYKGPRIAPFDPLQVKAQQMGERTGLYAPFLNKAETKFNAASKTFPEKYKDYMNPWRLSVANEIANLANRNYKENMLPQINSQFIGLGQHGSGKHQDLVARTSRDVQEAIMAEQARSLASGYEHSGRMFNADQERLGHVGQMYGDLGNKTQASHFADVEMLNNIGTQKQNLGQEDLDSKYQEFLNQKNYGPDKMVQMSSVLSGFPYQGQSYGAAQVPPRQPPKVNTLGQVGSLAGNLWGARMAQGTPRKKGGHIKSNYRPRGLGSMGY